MSESKNKSNVIKVQDFTDVPNIDEPKNQSPISPALDANSPNALRPSPPTNHHAPRDSDIYSIDPESSLTQVLDKKLEEDNNQDNLRVRSDSIIEFNMCHFEGCKNKSSRLCQQKVRAIGFGGYLWQGCKSNLCSEHANAETQTVIGDLTNCTEPQVKLLYRCNNLSCNLGYQKAQQQRELTVIKIALSVLSLLIVLLSCSAIALGQTNGEIPDLTSISGQTIPGQVMISTEDPESKFVDESFTGNDNWVKKDGLYPHETYTHNGKPYKVDLNALDMIIQLTKSPDFSDYKPDTTHTMNVRKFFEKSSLGGPHFTFLTIENKDNRVLKINTPFLDMVSQQANQGYYKIKNIQAFRGSNQQYDLWLLAKQLTRDEREHLVHFISEDQQERVKCCWQPQKITVNGDTVETFGFSRYVEDDAHLAYRLIHYNKITGIIYTVDEVVSNNSETNELTQFTRTVNGFANNQKFQLSKDDEPVAEIQNDEQKVTDYFVDCGTEDKDVIVSDFANIEQDCK